jgi:hypothetical protein
MKALTLLVLMSAPAFATPGTLYKELARGDLDAVATMHRPDPGSAESTNNMRRSNERFRNYASSTPSVDPSQGLTAAERAAVTVNTSVEGASAGINVSPFALTSLRSLHGLTFTVAALEDSSTRLGLGYVLEHRKEPGFSALGLTCKVDLAKVTRTLEDTEPAYLRACEVIAAVDSERACLGAADPCKTLVNAGRRSCDLPGALDLPSTVTQAASSITAMWSTIAADAKPELTQRQLAAFAKLAEFSMPRPLDCADAEEIDKAVTRWVWKQWTGKVSLAGHIDTYPVTLGFNPENLRDFEQKGREIRLDVLLSRRGFEFGAGVGWGTERSDRGEDYVGAVSPSFRVSKVIGALDETELEHPATKELRLEDDGSLPPILVIGVQGEFSIATGDVENDSSKLRSMTITPHIDFRYSDDLAFRLGVPFAMKRIASSTDPTDVGSQWTIPVFVATVLTL